MKKIITRVISGKTITLKINGYIVTRVIRNNFDCTAVQKTYNFGIYNNPEKMLDIAINEITK